MWLCTVELISQVPLSRFCDSELRELFCSCVLFDILVRVVTGAGVFLIGTCCAREVLTVLFMALLIIAMSLLLSRVGSTVFFNKECIIFIFLFIIKFR